MHLRKVRPRIRGEAAPMHSVRTGSGKPLLLVHRLDSSIGNWDPIVPTLTDAVADFIKQQDLADVDIVVSSMGPG